jgi:hypothetical protein
MENFERKLKRAGFRCRQNRRRADAKPVNPQKKQRSASVVRKKLKALGIDHGICLGCGSTDVSTFQFDHIAGRKHHHQRWPLCFDCHQEKTFIPRSTALHQPEQCVRRDRTLAFECGKLSRYCDSVLGDRDQPAPSIRGIPRRTRQQRVWKRTRGPNMMSRAPPTSGAAHDSLEGLCRGRTGRKARA